MQQPPFTVRLQGTFKWDAEAQEALRGTFGLQAFRPLQQEVINCTMSGRHCLCLMPSGGMPLLELCCCPKPHMQLGDCCTRMGAMLQPRSGILWKQSNDSFALALAGGKSLCYQLPALVAPQPLGAKGAAVTLVISPLLSLIQVRTEQADAC